MHTHIKIKRKKFTLEKLAEGSFASIYKAKHVSNYNNCYIIKVISDKFIRTKHVLERVSDEISILKSLDKHSYFPSDVISGTLGKNPYFGYKYIPGFPLISRLRDWNPDKFTLEYCINIFDQLLQAIAILHNAEHSLVHSDISPENIILSSGKIYLIDLGCAQHIDNNTSANKWIGKPSYLSPEQARGESWRQQSDIYQAGIILYECISGKRWNLGTTQAEKIAFASNPNKHQFKDIPLWLRPLLRSMLNPLLEKRVKTVEICLSRLYFAKKSLLRRPTHI